MSFDFEQFRNPFLKPSRDLHHVEKFAATRSRSIPAPKFVPRTGQFAGILLEVKDGMRKAYGSGTYSYSIGMTRRAFRKITRKKARAQMRIERAV